MREQVSLLSGGVCADPPNEPFFERDHPDFAETARVICSECPLRGPCEQNRVGIAFDLGMLGVEETVIAGQFVDTRTLVFVPLREASPAPRPPELRKDQVPGIRNAFVRELLDLYDVPVVLGRRWWDEQRESNPQVQLPATEEFEPMYRAERQLAAAYPSPDARVSRYIRWRVAMQAPASPLEQMDSYLQQSAAIVATHPYMPLTDALHALVTLSDTEAAAHLHTIEQRMQQIRKMYPDASDLGDEEAYRFARGGQDYMAHLLRYISPPTQREYAT